METERKPSPDSDQGDHRVGSKCTGGTINFTGALISVDSLSNILWGTYKAQINSDNPTEDKIEQSRLATGHPTNLPDDTSAFPPQTGYLHRFHYHTQSRSDPCYPLL